MRTLLITVGAVLAVGLTFVSALRSRHRRLGIAAFAQKHGFHHRPGDPFGLLYEYNLPLL